jgi:hypothetical protein
MTALIPEDLAQRWAREHQAEVDAGKHDESCEYKPGHWICDCSRRRRIDEGNTEPLGELIQHNPDCPRCYQEVEFDGDCFVCQTCCGVWSTDLTWSHFSDE